MEQKVFSDSVFQGQLMMPLSPGAVIQTDQYPDMLQQCTTEQCKLIFESLALANNQTLVNKVGTVGGYTALHWYIFCETL